MAYQATATGRGFGGIPPLLATIAFLVLFPGFAVYHFSVANGWIPAFAGGMFGNVSLLVTLLFVPLVPWFVFTQSRGAAGPIAATLGMMLFFGLWITAHFAVSGDAPHVASAATQASATLILWAAMIFTGTFVAIDHAFCRRALLAFAVVIAGLLAHSMIGKAMLIGPWLTLITSETTEQYATYQGIGRSILVTTVILGAAYQPRVRGLIFVLGVLALMSVGSRSDFFALTALTLASGFVSGRRAATQTLSVLVVLVPIVAFIAWPVFMETRFGEIFALSTSGSWQSRASLTEAALAAVRRSPILGDFAYHTRELTIASYSHNALSAWTSFGLVGFLMYLGTIMYFGIVSLRRMLRTGGTEALWVAAFFLNAAALIQAIAASSVFNVLPAFAWGIALNALRTERALSPLPAMTANDAARY